MRPAEAAQRLVVVGDSLAAGRFADAQAQAFPQQVAAATRSSLELVGVPGATTADLAAQAVPGQGDVVVVEAGTNDVLSQTPLRRFADDYRALLAKVTAASPGAKLVCLTTWISKDDPPPAKIAPSSYDAAIRRACGAGVVADIAPIFDAQPATRGPAGRPTFLGPGDEFHPNSTGPRRDRAGDRSQARLAHALQRSSIRLAEVWILRSASSSTVCSDAFCTSPFAAEAFERPKSAANIRRPFMSWRCESASGSGGVTIASSLAESTRLRCAVPIFSASSFGCRAWVIPSVVWLISSEIAAIACSSCAQAAMSFGAVKVGAGEGVAVAAATVALAGRGESASPPQPASSAATLRTQQKDKNRIRREAFRETGSPGPGGARAPPGGGDPPYGVVVDSVNVTVAE